MTKELTMNRIATLNMMPRIVGETRRKYLLFQWGIFYRERHNAARNYSRKDELGFRSNYSVNDIYFVYD